MWLALSCRRGKRNIKESTITKIQAPAIAPDDTINDTLAVWLSKDIFRIGRIKIQAAVNTAAVIACRHFPSMYGIRLSPASAAKRITCKCTQNPENPTIKDA